MTDDNRDEDLGLDDPDRLPWLETADGYEYEENASPLKVAGLVLAGLALLAAIVGGGNVLAFFELPTCAPMGRDENTPAWTQHLALEVPSMEELLATKARLQASGIEVVGVTDHTLFKSIYFFDPNGHRLELACNTATAAMFTALDAVKREMLDEWDRRKSRASAVRAFVDQGHCLAQFAHR